MYVNRAIEPCVTQDLRRKMVFIGGPRQAGKTCMAKYLLNKQQPNGKDRYLNWDALADREKIMKETFPTGSGLLILDEVHKYANWRHTVKGLYDKRRDELDILVTGSARLDYYRRGGDSLQGRYFFYHLFPFTLSELPHAGATTLQDLMHYSGFPEPFLLASERETRRWSREYRFRCVREDLRDLERVHEIDKIERMMLRLPELVGSPLSINALREDLQVAHRSVSRWLVMLENLFVLFRVYPFGAATIRAVKKEAKHYHLDWTQVQDEGKRFENLVAVHLLKWCYFMADTQGHDMELRYFRDIDGREVDFVLLKGGVPIHFIECKKSGKTINRALRYLKKKFPEVASTQISLENTADLTSKDGIRSCAAHMFLRDY